MIDREGFIKLFNLNIPKLEYFDYYIEKISKFSRYADIYDLISLYEKCSYIEDINQFKVCKSREVIDFIKSTNAFMELCYDKNLIDYDLSTHLEYEEGKKFLSIDIKDSNWKSLKKYDDLNELGESYGDLISQFEMPEIFSRSKYLRKFVLGNIDPKRISKIQRNLIQEIIEKYSRVFSFEFVRIDEAIFSFNDFRDLSILKSLDDELFKFKIFSVERIEDFRIDTIYNMVGSTLRRELSNIDDSKFYLKNKQFITGEQIDVRDLYFKHKGKSAIWEIDNLELIIK